jgi:predicted amidophosphoribosyltransferase
MITPGICRVCQAPAHWTLCPRCFAKLYPDATRRHRDTQHARRVARDARAYDEARAADEADAPPKDS